MAVLMLGALGNTALAELQRSGKKGGLEEFATEDPYTKGESERIRKLGYERLGQGPWHGAEDTQALQRNLGGMDLLFVETAHFRIASSLGTYRIPNDRAERAKLATELERLEEKLGRLKPPKRELDPWLRLHLFAQRAEDQYDELCAELGITPGDFAESDPYLGFPNKFLLVLCQRRSEFGRYVGHYHESTVENAFHTGWPGDTMVVAANQEALTAGRERETEVPYDSLLHCLVASLLTSSFLDGYGGDVSPAPRWFLHGLAHAHQRRIDPRWSSLDAPPADAARSRDRTDWEPRVYNLVKNGFFASAGEMFAWKSDEELDERDHLVAWSKTEFLMTELPGDRKAFLAAITRATGDPAGGDGAASLVARQEAALRNGFGLTGEELDRAWGKWVTKTYRKR